MDTPDTTTQAPALHFHCGAKIALPDPAACTIRAGGRLVVFATGQEMDHPTMNDGKRAPCFMGCPCRSRAGRKMERCWIQGDDETKEATSFVVTCKVKERT